ncbi:hypothetical protein Nepgr_032401 [Nepenthes gracilis]|uniref:Protein EARLY FLOWERING 4 domain-containing protein n=1 Tax=Nepenthes gracilis TaxID=150966 RepID=A0AAD3TII9_NEPGR|nr:hypothetical protein Nepgr_032401 [Nepenthes gracilis]
MEDVSDGDHRNQHRGNRCLQTLTATEAATANNRRINGFSSDATAAGGVDDDIDAEECDAEVWNEFERSIGQVQTVLDRNRTLIQQVNENHQSRILDNLVKNVPLIQEINGNISKVVSIYSDLSTNFSTMFHQRREMNSKSNADKKGGGTVEE